MHGQQNIKFRQKGVCVYVQTFALNKYVNIRHLMEGKPWTCKYYTYGSTSSKLLL